VYSIDAAVEGGKGPIHVHVNKESPEEEEQKKLGCKYNAPLKEKENFCLSEKGYRMDVSVLAKKGKKFVVRVALTLE